MGGGITSRCLLAWMSLDRKGWQILVQENDNHDLQYEGVVVGDKMIDGQVVTMHLMSRTLPKPLQPCASVTRLWLSINVCGCALLIGGMTFAVEGGERAFAFLTIMTLPSVIVIGEIRLLQYNPVESVCERCQLSPRLHPRNRLYLFACLLASLPASLDVVESCTCLFVWRSTA